MVRKTRRVRRNTQRGGEEIPPIHIVYFCYIDSTDGVLSDTRSGKLIIEQIKDLVDTGLAEAAKSVHITLAVKRSHNFNDATERRINSASNLIHGILPKAEIHRSPGNRYEYPGIRRVWDLAKKTPAEEVNKTLILYFHSKGMNNGNHSRTRTTENVFLTEKVIKPWKEIVARFQSEPALNKAGYAASEKGFIWYNFWWARASYLQGCPRPILTENRYYYEDWLGRRKQEKNTNEGETGIHVAPSDCLSLCVNGPSTPLGSSIQADMKGCN